MIGLDDEKQVQTYVTDPVDYQKSLNGKPRLRIAYIKSSNLHNITVSLRNQAGLQDIYFIQDMQRSFLSDSAYLELPQGV